MQSEGEVKERLQNMSTQSLLEGGLSGQKQVVYNTKLFLAKREIYCCGTFQQMGVPGSRDARWQFLQICIQIGHIIGHVQYQLKVEPERFWIFLKDTRCQAGKDVFCSP